jgi:hypothetical protein
MFPYSIHYVLKVNFSLVPYNVLYKSSTAFDTNFLPYSIFSFLKSSTSPIPFLSPVTSALSVTVFYASMTSGLIYSVITMPLETAKNRMAFQKPDAVTGKSNGQRSYSLFLLLYLSAKKKILFFSFILFSLFFLFFRLIFSSFSILLYLTSYSSLSYICLSHPPPPLLPIVNSSSSASFYYHNSLFTGILPYRGAFQTMSAIAGKEGTYCTVLCCTVLYCAGLNCTALYYPPLYCAVLHYTVLHYTVLHSTILHYTMLYCTALYCAGLNCTVMCSTVLC